jgi:hypothetical protein
MTPELPYAGKEGFVGREASVERARRNAKDGTAANRQEQVLQHLWLRRERGATWIEVGEALQLHHGQISATLSVLHKSGKVFQLREKRGRSHPYVHSDFRYIYVASERHDEPTRTTAGQLQSRLDEAIPLLVVALEECETNPFLDMTRETRLIRQALGVLRGEVA